MAGVGTVRKLKNLYAGIIEKKLVGGIDVEWAKEHQQRYLEIISDGETVLFVDLDILFKRENERKETEKSNRQTTRA